MSINNGTGTSNYRFTVQRMYQGGTEWAKSDKQFDSPNEAQAYILERLNDEPHVEDYRIVAIEGS